MHEPALDTPWTTLIIEDEPRVANNLRAGLEPVCSSIRCVESAVAAIEALKAVHHHLILLDLGLPDANGITLLPLLRLLRPTASIVVVTATTTTETVVQAMRAGADDFLPKPVRALQLRDTALRLVRAQQALLDIAAILEAADGDPTLVTCNPAFARLLVRARKAAEDICAILILGETGTGKGVLARAIRRMSARASKPFITVNCPALSNNDMMNEELFGHVRGAFTSALGDVRGKVALAELGTLFFDELGELPLDVQVRLLRFLQEWTYERVGDPKELRADVRIISATNRDLDAAVREGRFRADLLYRLDGLTLTVPPLRERPEDILTIAYTELRKCMQRKGILGELAFSAAAEERLLEHRWPGNVRELEAAVRRAVTLHSGKRIEPEDFELKGDTVIVKPRPVEPPKLVTLAQNERAYIKHALEVAGSLGAAAKALDIDRGTLRSKCKLYGLI